jgi:hypothetical protein
MIANWREPRRDTATQKSRAFEKCPQASMNLRREAAGATAILALGRLP